MIAGMVDDRPMQVLVLAPRGRDAALIERTLGTAGIQAKTCATVSDLASAMKQGAGAALIAEEALTAQGLAVIAVVVNSQPSWSDFPVILLRGRGFSRLARDWPGEALSSAAILSRPLTPETLVSVVRVALRSRRRQYELKAHLAAQQQYVAEVLEGIYDGYLSMDWQWRCVYANQRGAALLQRRSEDLIGANMLDIMPHWTTGNLRSLIEEVMATGQPFSIEERCPIHNLWFDLRCGRSADGLSFFFCDITRRKQSEEHLRLVVNELSHRVKNTLAVINVIADQSFKTGDDLGSIRRAFQGRLRALAETHTLLTVAHWESVDMAALVKQSLSHISDFNGARMQAGGDTVRLTPKASLSIGMTLHELSTNAAKYGALATNGGSVSVHWRITDGTLLIEWTEQQDGSTVVAAPTRKGFGTRMIDQAIEYELGGEVTRQYLPSGLHCLLTVPGGQTLAA